MKFQLLSAIFAVLLAAIVFSFFVNEQDSEEQLYGSSVLSTVSNKGVIKVSYDYTAPYELQMQRFEELRDVARSKNGIYGIYVKNLSTQDEFGFNEKESFYGASLLKLPIAIATYEQINNNTISLDDKVEYKQVDYSFGTGTIVNEEFGSQYTVAGLLNKLLKESDNVAQSMLTRKVGEGEIANSFNSFGPNGAVSRLYSDNITSPYEVGAIFENIYGDDTKPLLNIMIDTFFDDRISQGLNRNTKFSHKIGSYGDDGVWHDCGIVLEEKPIVVCLMSSGTTYNEFLDIAELVGNFVESINL